MEEDPPRAHDILREWVPDFDSALLIYDEGSGFRQFLGADVQTGWTLRDLCNEHIELRDSFVMSTDVAELSEGLVDAILPNSKSKVEGGESLGALSILQVHFYPELLDAIVSEIKQLITSGTQASDIVVVAPYLSDALRFSITNRLEARNIPWRSHRPSRSLHDEPASHALITLAALAHPQWRIHPPKFDVAYALIRPLTGSILSARNC